MDINILKTTASNLVSEGKGILAADESSGTIQKRFEAIGVESTEENRLIFRQMLFTAPGVENYLAGVILYDETIRQSTTDGAKIPELLEKKGIMPGIKVDKGALDLPNFPGEKVTEGLDGLRDRLKEYRQLGAKFAKWRAVITIGEGIPTDTCIEANAEVLARYAALCQEQDIVPMVEPEVLMDGIHTIEQCREATLKTLKVVFERLKKHKVLLEGVILKPNMVVSGKEAETQADSKEVAKQTVEVLKEAVPKEIPGIAFLSGGQSSDFAIENLREINLIPGSPWQLTFSYSRALQKEAMEAWKGVFENLSQAQEIFLEKLKKASDARSAKA